jgi:molybdopterin-guanine dinucleotide biosynthesis protein A
MSRFAWTGVVLAGGKSTRMGRDKAFVEVDGKPMIQHALELLRPQVKELLLIGDPRKYRRFHDEIVEDELEGLGPLGGIVTAMGHAKYDHLLVLACDVPEVNAQLLEKIKHHFPMDGDSLVPRHGDLVEPLVAGYHKRCAEPFTDLLRKGVLRMTEALASVRTHYLDITPGQDGWPEDLFRNVEGPDDL